MQNRKAGGSNPPVSSIKSNSTDEYIGLARFEKKGSKTLFTYRSFIKPRSVFARFVKSRAKDDIKSTIKEIVRYTIFLNKKDPKKMNHFKKLILDSINGHKVYLK